MKLYHGTQVQNIEQLRPFATRGNAISKPAVCFTPNYGIALLYIWNRSYKWVTFGEDENGKLVFTEHYENMFYDFYKVACGRPNKDYNFDTISIEVIVLIFYSKTLIYKAFYAFASGISVCIKIIEFLSSEFLKT